MLNRLFVCYLQSEHPQTVVVFLGYAVDSDLDALMGHSVLRPVLCTFLQGTNKWIFYTHVIITLYLSVCPSVHHSFMPHLVFLFQVGDHHYDWASLLPHHPPEVPHCVHGGTLGGNVGTLLIPIALQSDTRTHMASCIVQSL